MKSVLEMLYNGELVPYEQIKVNSRAYRDMRQSNVRKYKDFAEKLGALSLDLKETFIQIMDEQAGPISLELSENFIEGFRLGARLMAEVYQTAYADCPE